MHLHVYGEPLAEPGIHSLDQYHGLTSFVPVLGMLLFGGETLKDFAFAMSVGLIAGSYSSIAVATPLFAMWKSHEPKNAKLVKKYGTDITRFSFASTPLLAAGVVEAAQPVATVDSVEETVVDKEANKNESSKKKAKKAGNSEPIRYRRKK